MTTVTDLQLDVLRELHDERNREWLTITALATLIDAQQWHVRCALSALRRERLVKRGDTLDLVGSYAITPTGIAMVLAANQTRLWA